MAAAASTNMGMVVKPPSDSHDFISLRDSPVGYLGSTLESRSDFPHGLGIVSGHLKNHLDGIFSLRCQQPEPKVTGDPHSHVMFGPVDRWKNIFYVDLKTPVEMVILIGKLPL